MGLTTWHRIRVADPKSLEARFLMQPLLQANKHPYGRCFGGYVAEAAHDYVFIITWRDSESWDSFRTGPLGEKIFGLWKEASLDGQIDTKMIRFSAIQPVGEDFHFITRVCFMSFPAASLTDEDRRELDKVRGSSLRDGWLDGTAMWDGQEVVVAATCFEMPMRNNHYLFHRMPQVRDDPSLPENCLKKAQAVGLLGTTWMTLHLKTDCNWLWQFEKEEFGLEYSSEEDEEDESEFIII